MRDEPEAPDARAPRQDSERGRAVTYERVLAQMADGVISLELDGCVVTCNAAAGRILGIEPQAVIGRPFAATFFDDGRLEELCDLVLKAILEAEIVHSAEIGITLGDDQRRLLVSTSFMTAGRAAAVGVIVVISDVTEGARRRKLKRLFGEYLDPRIVERLSAGEQQIERGIRTLSTVMFLDLQGFTGVGQQLPPAELVEFLNLFFGMMTDPVHRSRGVTDKYIGDAILAYWGPPFVEEGNHAELACRCALEQRRCLQRLRREALARFGLPAIETLDMRIGLATGELVAGSIGPPGARNFTIIGDTVNLAARLEAANKQCGTRILASAATREAAAGGLCFGPALALTLPGRGHADEAHELLGEIADDGTPTGNLSTI